MPGEEIIVVKSQCMDELLSLYETLQEGKLTPLEQGQFLNKCITTSSSFDKKEESKNAIQVYQLFLNAVTNELIDIAALCSEQKGNFLGLCYNSGVNYYKSNQVAKVSQSFQIGFDAVINKTIDIDLFSLRHKGFFLVFTTNAGIIYCNQNKADKASQAYQLGLGSVTNKAIDIEELSSEHKGVFLTLCYNAGIIFRKQNLVEKVSQAHQLGFDAVNNRLIDVDLLTSNQKGYFIQLCYHVGNSFYNKGLLNEASHAYQHIFDAVIKNLISITTLPSEYKGVLLQLCFNAAINFSEQGQFDLELQAYLFFLDSVTRKEVDLSLLSSAQKGDFLILCNNACLILKKRNQIQKALQFYLQALDAVVERSIDIAELNSKHQYAFLVLCCNAGKTFYDQNKIDKAVQAYKQGLDAVINKTIDIMALSSNAELDGAFLDLCVHAGRAFKKIKQVNQEFETYQLALYIFTNKPINIGGLSSNYKGNFLTLCLNTGVIFETMNQPYRTLQTYLLGLNEIINKSIEVSTLPLANKLTFLNLCDIVGILFENLSQIDYALEYYDLGLNALVDGCISVHNKDVIISAIKLINFRFNTSQLIHPSIQKVIYASLPFSLDFKTLKVEQLKYLNDFFHYQPHQSFILSSVWLQQVDPAPYLAFKASANHRNVSRDVLYKQKLLIKDVSDFYLYHLSRGITAPNEIATALNDDHNKALYSDISSLPYSERKITLQDNQTSVVTTHYLWQEVNTLKGKTGLTQQIPLLVSLLALDENQRQKQRLHWLSFEKTQGALLSFTQQAKAQTLLMRLWSKSKVQQQYKGLSRLCLTRRAKPILRSQGVTYSALPQAIKRIKDNQTQLHSLYKTSNQGVYQKIDKALFQFTHSLRGLDWYNTRILLSHVVEQEAHNVIDDNVDNAHIEHIIEQWCNSENNAHSGYYAFIQHQEDAKTYREKLEAITQIKDEQEQQKAANKLPSKPIWGDALSNSIDLPEYVFLLELKGDLLLPNTDQGLEPEQGIDQQQRAHIQAQLISAWQYLAIPDEASVLTLWHSFEQLITDEKGQSIPKTTPTTLKWIYLTNQHETMFHTLLQRYLQQHYPVNEKLFSRQYNRWSEKKTQALAELGTHAIEDIVNAIKQQLSFFISYPDIEVWQTQFNDAKPANLSRNKTSQALLLNALDGFQMSNTNKTDTAQLIRWLDYFTNEAIKQAAAQHNTELVWKLLEMRRVGLLGSMRKIDKHDMRWGMLLEELTHAWTYSADMDNANPTELHPLLATWQRWCFDNADPNDNLMPAIRSPEDVACVLKGTNDANIVGDNTLLVQIFSTQGDDISESQWHVLSLSATSNGHDLTLTNFSVNDTDVLASWSELYSSIDEPFLDKPNAFDKAYNSTIQSSGIYAVLSHIKSLVKTTRVALLLEQSLSHLPWEFLITHQQDNDDKTTSTPRYINTVRNVSIERVVSVSHWRTDKNKQHITAHPNENKWCAIYNSHILDNGTHYAKYDAQHFLNSQTHIQKNILSGQLNCMDVMDAFSKHSHIHITAHGEYNAMQPWSTAINLGLGTKLANTAPSLKLPLYAFNDISQMPVHVSLGSCELAREGQNWVPLGMASGLIAKGVTRVIAPLMKVEALPNLLFFYYLYQGDSPINVEADTKAHWIRGIQEAQRKVKDTTLGEIYHLLKKELTLNKNELGPLIKAYPIHSDKDGQVKPFNHPIYWSGYVLLAGKY